MKIYDRNRNALKLGQRVMIAATGAVDTLKEAHTDNLSPYQAEHEKCVLLTNSQERYAPIELIRLGKVRTSIPRTKNENFSHLISMGYQ